MSYKLLASCLKLVICDDDWYQGIAGLGVAVRAETGSMSARAVQSSLTTAQSACHLTRLLRERSSISKLRHEAQSPGSLLRGIKPSCGQKSYLLLWIGQQRHQRYLSPQFRYISMIGTKSSMRYLQGVAPLPSPCTWLVTAPDSAQISFHLAISAEQLIIPSCALHGDVRLHRPRQCFKACPTLELTPRASSMPLAAVL